MNNELNFETMDKQITYDKAIKFIEGSFDEDGFLINPSSNYRKRKANLIIDQHGDKLYEDGMYNAVLIIANPNSQI